MSSSLSYSRKFIILKKELGNIKRGNIKGHCKIERKGPKIILTANVENGDLESIYNLALFTDGETPITVLGKLFTDEMGKGKGEYVLTERELGGNGSKLKGILVMLDKDILLAGYIDKEDGSIERYIDSLALETRIEDKEETPLQIEEINVEETVGLEEVKPVEELSHIEETNPLDENIAIGVSSSEEINTNELVYPESNPVEEEMFTEEAPSISQHIFYNLDDDSYEPDYKTLEYLKRLNQKNQTVNYVLSILRFFPYAEPFKYNLKGYNWWLVDLDSENEYKAFLPYFAHVVGGNNKEYYDNGITTCNQLMNKYQHYLFGLYNEGEEVKYFLYGIPGTFTIDEHPYRGANGFNTWYEGVNAPGYWIIYIDPMTGKAVNLPNPMIPIR